MDNRYYNNQQQISHPSNQFGVPFSMNGKCNSGYYSRQQPGLSDYSGDQFGSLLIRSNNSCYGGPQVTPVNYYDPSNSDSASTNHGYYGREQQVFNHGGYKRIEPANFLNINSGYYDAQEQSESNYRQPSEMQNDFDRYTVVERLAADGMIDRSNGEFSSSYHSGDTNSMKHHPGTIISEQQVPVEQLYITHQINGNNSAPINDHYCPIDRDIALINGFGRLNTNITPASGPVHPSDPSFAFANHFDRPRNSSSSLVSGPIYSQITNSVPILSLGNFQDRSSVAVVSPSHSMNGNYESVNGFHNLWDNNSALVADPGCLMNTNLASIPGPVNTSFTGLENNNSALTNSPLQPKNSNPALDGGSGRLANSKDILVSDLGHPQDSSPRFTSDLTPPANSNSALIKFPCPGLRPPRWCNETFDATTPILSSPPTLFKGLILRKYENEKNDLKNPLSSPFLESIFCGSTSFENLARVDSVSRTDLSLAYIPHCPLIMKGRCQNVSKLDKWCSDKIHFKRMVYVHTDVRLGDCSFLDSCDMMDKCPYIHYVPELPEIVKSHFGKLTKEVGDVLGEEETGARRLADDVGPVPAKDKAKLAFSNIQHPPNASPPQWIRCDVRQLDLKILGKFGAVMADPPWDIRMTLPYGTVPDQAIIDLPFKDLQDEGVFFLWCTARAVDTGRACLKAWGYRFSDEIAWVKADHLRRLISVGRTGHWLNHTMEHCLVGIKGDPEWIRKGCDTDVIVSQPRATSHKPDEIYELIERLVGPHTRKLEIFGREHNIRKGWLTLGNQLSSTYLHEKNLKEALIKELAHNNNTRCYYSPDWDPWAGGFTRYGYGGKSDWREERRLGANRANSRGRSSREIRGGSNGDGGSDATTVNFYVRKEKGSDGGGGSDATTVNFYVRKEKEGEAMVELTEEI